MDSVYQHVLAWREVLETMSIQLSVWKIHRRIGMSGGLFVNALLRETGLQLDVQEIERLRELHVAAYLRRFEQVRPLPGSCELLARLSGAGVPWAIATSASLRTARPAVDLLGVPASTVLVTREDVARAKPDPDLFLEAAKRLKVSINDSFVIGDSVWDLLAAQRARALGVGVLSGGYGREELQQAGAYRVYDDPADLLLHLDEVGVRERPS